jgi:hypothetical protein
MPPADPPQRNPSSERDPYEADDSELGEAAGPDAYDLDALQKQGNVPGLLALAKVYRAGTAPGGRDMAQCLEAYRAAASLGSAEAEYAIALFYMNGGTVVPQDLRQGTLHLRTAAEKGSIPAKVYLGNLYELGINYKADSEKADVWYRNAARGARVEAEPGTDEFTRALADLGCARYALLTSRDPAASDDDKNRVLARAKAHGWGLRIREDITEGDRPTFVHALATAESAGATATATPPPVAVDVAGGARGGSGADTRGEPRQRKDTSPETAQAKRRAEEAHAKTDPPKAPLDPAAAAAAEKADRLAKKRSAERSEKMRGALAAFGYALLFALAGAGAGYAATLGARELVAHGHVLPLVGTKTRLVFPIVLALVGVLPAWLVYRLGTVVKALGLGAVAGAIGWVAWGTGQYAFHGDRPLQALAFALAGFLAGLLVLGLIGGAKIPRAKIPRATIGQRKRS